MHTVRPSAARETELKVRSGEWWRRSWRPFQALDAGLLVQASEIRQVFQLRCSRI